MRLLIPFPNSDIGIDTYKEFNETFGFSSHWIIMCFILDNNGQLKPYTYEETKEWVTERYAQYLYEASEYEYWMQDKQPEVEYGFSATALLNSLQQDSHALTKYFQDIENIAKTFFHYYSGIAGPDALQHEGDYDQLFTSAMFEDDVMEIKFHDGWNFEQFVDIYQRNGHYVDPLPDQLGSGI